MSWKFEYDLAVPLQVPLSLELDPCPLEKAASSSRADTVLALAVLFGYSSCRLSSFFSQFDVSAYVGLHGLKLFCFLIRLRSRFRTK